MNLNAPPPSEQDHGYHHDQPYPQLFGPSYRLASSSSSSGSCHIFLDSAQDPTGFYHHQFYQHHPKEDHTYAYSGGSSSYEIKNKAETSGLKLTLWKKEPDHHDHDHDRNMDTHEMNRNNPVKWMSSKMRVMQKMKIKPDHRTLKITSSSKTKIERDHDRDHKLQQSSSFGANNASTIKNSSYNGNSPIRVCSDCNTTKTPLWRSGPKGPKSLCNACGIRQRKARRALAAAGNNAAGIASEQATNALKIKVPNKEKSMISKHVPLKKRYRLEAAAASSTTSGGSPSPHGRKIEDFLINFSKNLTFHRMFPEDEKDAAILLMALSSGLIQG